MYICHPISQFIPTPLSPLVSIHLFSTSVSLFLPCKPVHLYHFSRFHIYALIYDTCFSLSDLLHSVWQSLGPSTSLQVTQVRSFLWLSNMEFLVFAHFPPGSILQAFCFFPLDFQMVAFFLCVNIFFLLDLPTDYLAQEPSFSIYLLNFVFKSSIFSPISLL